MNNACDTSICDVGRVQPQVARFDWMTRAPHAIYRVLASWIATIGARGWEDSTSPARPQSLPILRNIFGQACLFTTEPDHFIKLWRTWKRYLVNANL